MRSRGWVTVLAVGLIWVAVRASAADPEGCLICHQYRGLSRLDDKGKEIRLFFVDPKFHGEAAGPHGRIRCTDCHERAQVEVFPHKAVTAVDCTRTCHLTTPRNVETRFGHDRIGQMLETSVHTKEVLERCNELLGRPMLRAGTARQCAYCHGASAPQLWLYWHDPTKRARVARCRRQCRCRRPMVGNGGRRVLIFGSRANGVVYGVRRVILRIGNVVGVAVLGQRKGGARNGVSVR